MALRAISSLPIDFWLILVLLFMINFNLITLLILIPMMIFVLQKFSFHQIENSQAEKVLKLENHAPVAHRGAAIDSPENTLAAFQRVIMLCKF